MIDDPQAESERTEQLLEVLRQQAGDRTQPANPRTPWRPPQEPPVMVTRWQVKSCTGQEAEDLLQAGWEPVSCTGVEQRKPDPMNPGQQRTVGIRAFWHLRRSMQVPLAGGLRSSGPPEADRG